MVLAIFSTGTYAIIGTTCVKSETCYEKYHEKKLSSISISDLKVHKGEFKIEALLPYPTKRRAEITATVEKLCI